MSDYPGDTMCPNCVTPWKCNGPHIPEDSELAALRTRAGEAERKLAQAEQQRDDYKADSLRLHKDKMDLWEIVHFPGGIEAQKAQARAEGMEEAIEILEVYKVPCGNSAAGEMAAEWTMDALNEIRDRIRAKMKEQK